LTALIENPVGTMRAAIIVEPGKIEIHSVAKPQPKSTQVRIKVEGCGICASNIPPWEGREWFSYPMAPGALGHEGWGIIDALGETVSGFEVGERVAFLSNNAYAEYDVAEEGSAVKLPSELDRLPFPAEPLACAINIFRRSHIEPGQSVGIVGIGFLGSLLVQLCLGAGARVIAIDRKPSALQGAAAIGAETIPMDDHWQIIEKVRTRTNGRMCDVVIEAVGKQWPLDLASELTKEMGRLVIAGYHQDGLRQVNLQLWNWRGLEVTNAHEREAWVYRRGMEEAVEAVKSKKIDPTPFFTHRFPLERLAEALDMAKERPVGFMKALMFAGASES
jgi:NADPH2:quinone reductase